MLKWFNFNQNNSGGSFITNDSVCHRVFIEATDEGEATDKALSLGVYFNGVDEGEDCECCGGRWYEPYDPVELLPEHTIEQYAQLLADKWGWTEPDAYLYRADGTKTSIFTNKITKKETI